MASPPSVRQVPLPAEGVMISIHPRSSAHCGRITVHWTIQSSVASRLLSVRGGVRNTDTTKRKLTERQKRRGKIERRGGKIAPKEDYKTG
ncbi:hypothetical protein CesoFtcFv8_016607 [Champsocephalus esox]|uniref:Uncharacterized protein n=1 Tax=Champsocephalus esox TaxID=159716 RepID=A0AAN8BMR2_9TELE|nr:hypothetical protein CesoFtcFv8_016607 [Champsocephalus esox]